MNPTTGFPKPLLNPDGAAARLAANAAGAAAHRRALLMMLAATLLWSLAGVFTRHIEQARGWEVAFWRSFFGSVFLLAALLWTRKAEGSGGAWRAVRNTGWAGIVSAAMWATMFTCFMLALMRTTTANTLIVNALSPLFAALLAWVVLKQPIPGRTWLAIVIAIAGIAWMFQTGLAADRSALIGTLIAFCIPVASAVNVVTLKRAGAHIDLVPAVLLGAMLSAAIALPAALPMEATARDIVILAFLGVVQLGVPCILMVRASRHLAAPEIALLTLLEVIEGPLWSWMFAGEVIAGSTAAGGLIVLGALILNEAAGMRARKAADASRAAQCA